MDSVFKYMAYRPEFFENFLLKASRFGEFNDPFEMVMGNALSTLSIQEYNRLMQSDIHLSDPANYYDYYWDAQCGARASLAVICFTSEGNDILMWSHYADSHKGICIEFNRDAPFFNTQFRNATNFLGSTIDDYYSNVGTLREVDYLIDRPSYFSPDELEHDTDSWFVKAPEWKYEEELRLLVPIELAKKIPENEFLFYPATPEIIQSVTLGCRMPSSTKKEVAAICIDQGIKVREAFIHSHQFKLDIVDYDAANQDKYLNMFNLNRISSW